MKTMWSAAAIAAAFILGFLARGIVPGEPIAYAQSGRVFELRTYTAPDGKLEELHKRFRDHTMRIFKNHGMTNIAYFRPQDAPQGHGFGMSRPLLWPPRRQRRNGGAPFGCGPQAGPTRH